MALVTVIGAANHTHSVTVSGTSDHTLQNQYKSAMGGSPTISGVGSNTLAAPSGMSAPVYKAFPAAPTIMGGQGPVHMNGLIQGRTSGPYVLGTLATISAAGDPSLQTGNSRRISVNGMMNFIGHRPEMDHGPEDVIFAETGQMSLYGAASGHYVLMGRDA